MPYTRIDPTHQLLVPGLYHIRQSVQAAAVWMRRMKESYGVCCVFSIRLFAE